MRLRDVLAKNRAGESEGVRPKREAKLANFPLLCYVTHVLPKRCSTHPEAVTSVLDHWGLHSMGSLGFVSRFLRSPNIGHKKEMTHSRAQDEKLLCLCYKIIECVLEFICEMYSF
ncbi:hypothetical protein TNCT_458191 [Trichonephila clavata]|uniref:Uncharacterized protein n=1 Tax=Trichonephila clavata TaxID=2740835 RepID=A0A8X6LFH7_TRICU|nr:hypothetical protein TNCT_458191 [Trichonephila clavata]